MHLAEVMRSITSNLTTLETQSWHNKSVHTEPWAARLFEIKVVRRDPVTSGVRHYMKIYTLAKTKKSDKEDIRILNERCYRNVVEKQFGDWNIEKQKGFFEDKWKNANFQKILVKNKLAGVISVKHHPDHIFLSEILIAPEYQGQGLGTEIMKNIIDSADKSTMPIKLQVLHENQAISLYNRLGFKTTGKTETHVLMQRNA